VRNLRCGFLTSAANDGKLQYRYLDSSSVVHWIDLKTGLTNVRLSYCSYWDTTALVKNVLWVDGSNNIFAWNGAVATFASATNSTGFLQTLSATPTAGGTGYTVGDTLTITGGTATVLVSTVSAGAVTAVSLVSTGSGYTSGTGKATTGGTGTSCTLDITAVASYSIVNQGSLTWAQQGFNQTSGSVVISGTSYTYAALIGNTMIGIGSDPTVGAYTAGTIMHQAVVTTTLASMASINVTLAPSVIGCGRANQVYLGSSSSNNLYISKVNSYTDYGFTTPVRVVGEGALIPIDAPPVAFISSEDRNTSIGGLAVEDLYISMGTGHWGIIRSILSADLSKETIEYIRMMVSPQQGAISGRLTGKMKNHIMFVSNDKVAQFFGIESFKNVPEAVDFSYTIVDDMKSYDFTDGEIYYLENYIYVTVPKSGLIRIFNMTNQTKQTTQSPSFYKTEDIDESQPWFWEAPITYPISGMYYTPDKGAVWSLVYNVGELPAFYWG